MQKLWLRKTLLLVLMIISFIYFQIHSCSEEGIIGPGGENGGKGINIDNKICLPRDIYFVDESFGWVVGAAGTAMYTVDGGENWSGVSLEDYNLRGVFFLDQVKGWIVGEDGSILRTTEGGIEWDRITFNGYPQDTDLYMVEFMNDTLGFIHGYGGVYRSEDGGMNWENYWLPVVPYRGSWGMSMVDEQRGYLLGSRWTQSDPNLIYRTDDGALSWSGVEGSKSSVLEAVMEIDFVDDTTGWTGGNTIKKTVNGGDGWETQLESAHVREFSLLSSERGFAVGGLKILKTADGGETWNDVTPPDEGIKDLRSVHFLDKDTGWVLGWGYDKQMEGKILKHTLILKTEDGGNSWKIRNFYFDYSGMSGDPTQADSI